MPSLADKRILLGVTGGIAAYKSADLVRRLQDRGATVRVVMTAGAREFVQPLTFQALSGNPVHTDLLDPAAEAAMGHIELAKWADVILIAPASASVMAKLAAGIADDLLTTLCLASDAPLIVAPAMNQAMWRNVATQDNAKTLQRRGTTLLGPGAGSQACGDVGPGRMLEPLDIVDGLIKAIAPEQVLKGKKVTITAGPTREALDPVRYLSNHSSGKMGFAIAAAAARAGAEVTLIAGPVRLDTPAGIKRVDVVSTEDMLRAAEAAADDCDLFIASAAVVDFRPTVVAAQKIKKEDDNESDVLQLVKNPDIVATIAGRTSKRPFVVGFAAETEKVAEHAKGKLARKNLDMIIANDVSDPEGGFNSDRNQVMVIDHAGEQALPAALKTELATQLVELIATRAFPGQHQ
ncbi:bifunctional phosphopantothenoylcysteine decarboxylase/phosphopantothenate--cysteine ligase CoaBC [Microbulbifer hydrolyticus]|uniref:Coenzyme A biosynthesis bifunctional protein CoaBC n=1 Tax=Microbulbifer hydrolyticus TaxID=48074 RepID=A0A6P1T7E5_9GAMM|nr:bifunctional phosphopantothenoylcysteine decarboxylase/phosphopantothenate--cysteine ligase CoaBC [Microbulbifer hydrolyticus]MBB5211654.1 phosphopantothenoylcysteine decarboxylase/phosphopantothenate--cysteine ligase [Microbulbifer hydrolyticus]QHQ37613.1 bifunctional phosphopantothenoylcysteine decarboxylase/phosphopantothenate--cysteine ligase CoaBC [Microbulbifer hydrolyticus]